MKNIYIERNIQSAKRYAKNWNRTKSARGNHIIHDYSIPSKLSWWDDVLFRVGSQIVVVWWTHPRMKYRDVCEDLAFNECSDYYVDWEIKTKKIQKPVGKTKSRKQTVAHEWLPPPEDHKTFYDKLRETEERILTTSDVVVKPHFKVKQLNWARAVDVCYPVEIIDQQSLEDMADDVKKVLTGQKTLDNLFDSSYTYTHNNWNTEHKPS